MKRFLIAATAALFCMVEMAQAVPITFSYVTDRVVIERYFVYDGTPVPDEIANPASLYFTIDTDFIPDFGQSPTIVREISNFSQGGFVPWNAFRNFGIKMPYFNTSDGTFVSLEASFDSQGNLSAFEIVGSSVCGHLVTLTSDAPWKTSCEEDWGLELKSVVAYADNPREGLPSVPLPASFPAFALGLFLTARASRRR